MRPAGWTGNLVQAWFPGVHSNVGGGYSPDGLANEALHWVVEKAEALDCLDEIIRLTETSQPIDGLIS